MPDSIDAKIAELKKLGEAICAHRAELFPACEALYAIGGPDGLRASMAGVVESVIARHATPPRQPKEA